MTIKFRMPVTTDEEVAVETICARAMSLFERAGIPGYTWTDIRMSLLAVHHSVGLNLIGLSKADEENFSHDISGIVGKLDRKTGELEGFFVPRYAVKKESHIMHLDA